MAAAPTAESTATREPEWPYEVVAGRILEMPPMGAFEAWIASELFRALALAPGVADRGRLVAEMLFRLEPQPPLERRPDLAFVTFDRWPRERPVPRASAWPVAPDLAVEVVSPTNRSVDDQAKLREYFRAGVRRIWVLYPDAARVYDYDGPTSVRILARGDALDGAGLLPGFAIALDDLFGPPDAAG